MGVFMPIEYAAPENMSTTITYGNKWRFALTALLLTVGIGTSVIVTLSLGTANPPRAQTLIVRYDNIDAFARRARANHVQIADAGLLPPLPLTIEVSASNLASEDSGWGVWVQAVSADPVFLVDKQGYTSISNTGHFNWAEFIHIQPGTNRLYLYIDQAMQATFRINDEIAWSGVLEINSESHWGIAQYHSPQLKRSEILLYSG
jgi:hypothetical protein